MTVIRSHVLSGKEKFMTAESGKRVMYYENAGRFAIVAGYVESKPYDRIGDSLMNISSISERTSIEKKDRRSVESFLRRRCSFW